MIHHALVYHSKEVRTMAMAAKQYSPRVLVLAKDPNTVCRLNANAFQQDAVTTFNNFQYVAYYTAASTSPDSVRHVTLARRNLIETDQDWEKLVLKDYNQTTDDGHNTISIGICTGDGTIHVSFDHHCDDLRYRISPAGVALNPSSHDWTSSLFGPVRNHLPGLEPSAFTSISYPRFVSAGDDLMFEGRTGKAGAGSDMMFLYSSERQTYTSRGTYLVGINNNPYPNGISFANGRMHVSWTYRDFVAYEGADDLDNNAHKAQAGPNGPENNFDLNYAYSDDCGQSWCNSVGHTIASLEDTQAVSEPGISPSAKNIAVQKIPKYSGIMNQESQCIGSVTGDFHVLNRDNTSGTEQWRHYLRDAVTGEWTSTAIPDVFPTETGSRGCIASDATGNSIYFLLPGNQDTSLTLLRRRKLEGAGYSGFDVLWSGEEYDGEPNIDRARLSQGDGILSVFTRTARTERDVVVLDFEL